MRRQMLTALAMTHASVRKPMFIILFTPAAKVFGIAKVNPSKHRALESHRSGGSATSADEVRRGESRRCNCEPGGTQQCPILSKFM